MPDRYGETEPNPGYPQAVPAVDDSETAHRLRAQAIAECDLCDHEGTRNGFACDHIDHRPAAARGMARIRAAMGWDR